MVPKDSRKVLKGYKKLPNVSKGAKMVPKIFLNVPIGCKRFQNSSKMVLKAFTAVL